MGAAPPKLLTVMLFGVRICGAFFLGWWLMAIPFLLRLNSWGFFHSALVGFQPPTSFEHWSRLSCRKAIRETSRLSNDSRGEPYLLQKLNRILGCGDP